MKCVKMELGNRIHQEEEGLWKLQVRILMDEIQLLCHWEHLQILITSTTEGLKTNKWQCIVADKKQDLPRDRVYAGGDCKRSSW